MAKAKPKAAPKPAAAKPKAAPKPVATKATATKTPAAPKPRKRTALQMDKLDALVKAAVTSLEDDKAENILVLDVTGRASFTDRMIVATGQVDRQLQAMATHVEAALYKAGVKLKRSAFETSSEWVLIDAGDLVVHLFLPDARATFNLEKLWSGAVPMGAADPI